MGDKEYCVYIMTNRYNNVLYTGVTNNLNRRVYEHKNHMKKGFTAKYNVEKLVYYETTTDIKAAIQRETNQKWFAKEENRFDRRRQLRMARPVSRLLSDFS